jgi:hypothetical protein
MGQNGVVEVSVADGKIAVPQVQGLVERSGTTVKVQVGVKVRFTKTEPYKFQHVAMSGSSPLANLDNGELQAIGIGDSYVLTLLKAGQPVDFVHLATERFAVKPQSTQVRSLSGNIYLRVVRHSETILTGGPTRSTFQFETYEAPGVGVEAIEFDGESAITVSFQPGTNLKLRQIVGQAQKDHLGTAPVVVHPGLYSPIVLVVLDGASTVATCVLNPRQRLVGDRRELLVTFDEKANLLKDYTLGKPLDYVEVPAGSHVSVANIAEKPNRKVVFVDVDSQLVLGTFSSDTIPRIQVEPGKKIRVSMVESDKAIASALIVAQSRRDSILRLDVGYVWAPMVNDDYSVAEVTDSGGTRKKLFSDSRGGFDSTPVLLTHYVSSDEVSSWITRPLRRLAGSDGVKVGFSFGIPAPGSNTPVQYLAGVTAMFGRRQDVAFTFGMAFGHVRKPIASFDPAKHDVGEAVPTTNKSKVTPFFGISLRTG